MKSIYIFLLSLLAMNNSAFAFKNAPELLHQEVYFRYYPQQYYVHIKEYNLSAPDMKTARQSLRAMGTLLSRSLYCDQRYGFTFLESIEEKVFRDGNFVTAECHLIVGSQDTVKVLADILKHLLQRDVDAGLEGKELRAAFDGSGIGVADNNAKGVFEKEGASTKLLIWKSKQKYYEAVFTDKQWPAGTLSLREHLPYNLHSPSLSDKEVSRLRLQQLAKNAPDGSLDQLKKLAAKGDVHAQVLLAMAYAQGKKNAAQDNEKALHWFGKAAAQGDEQAQTGLARMYAEGMGIKRNYAKAREWLNKAAAQNYAPAQYNLALMYGKGLGVEQDDDKSFQLLQKSAQSGFARAQYSLGLMYAKGQGVKVDAVKAVQWMRKAAAQGNEDAMIFVQALADRMKQDK